MNSKSVPVYFPTEREDILIGTAKVKYDGTIRIQLYDTQEGDSFKRTISEIDTIGFTLGYLTMRSNNG